MDNKTLVGFAAGAVTVLAAVVLFQSIPRSHAQRSVAPAVPVTPSPPVVQRVPTVRPHRPRPFRTQRQEPLPLPAPTRPAYRVMGSAPVPPAAQIRIVEPQQVRVPQPQPMRRSTYPGMMPGYAQAPVYDSGYRDFRQAVIRDIEQQRARRRALNEYVVSGKGGGDLVLPRNARGYTVGGGSQAGIGVTPAELGAYQNSHKGR